MMKSPINQSANPTAAAVALAIAPAAIGAAAGMLIGETMRRRARRNVTLGILAVGILATVPLVVSIARQRLFSPSSRRGSARTLRAIREGIDPTYASDFDYAFEGGEYVMEGGEELDR